MPSGADPADELRSMLRADLTAAMKARQPDAVRALRTAIAAIDNAEAVEARDAISDVTSEHVAGGQAGVGAAEAQRRDLSVDDIRGILNRLVVELMTQADAYAAHDNPDRAALLRGEAAVLRAYADQ